MRRSALAALCAALALPAAAEEPRSAIPWLSQSIEDLPPAERPSARPAPPARTQAGEIAVTPLPGIALDAVGLLGPEDTGFPRALWGPAFAPRVRSLILAHRDTGVPAARALFRQILLAEADPPKGPGSGSTVLVARIDRLLAVGALAEADALVERAGAETPALFRRMFDIGLLLDRAEPACEALRRNPSLSPTLPARIFCLARAGDWNAAEITLTLGRNVGSLSDDEEAALARFLDPELFEHLPPPPVPDPFTPLDFLLREAVGLPRPPGVLPLAFVHHDLAEWMPVRSRMVAAERLVAEAAVPPSVLFDAYRAGRPAASGGVWDRSAAVQALDAALAAEDGAGLAEALAEADTALARRGLRPAFARSYADPLAELDPEALPEAVRLRVAELLLLAGRTEDAADALPPQAPPAMRRLMALARGVSLPPSAMAEATPLEAAAHEGMMAGMPTDERADRLARLLDEKRVGEMMLAALALVTEGPRTDPASLRAALHGLRQAGQVEAARRIALETLLLAGEGEP